MGIFILYVGVQMHLYLYLCLFCTAYIDHTSPDSSLRYSQPSLNALMYFIVIIHSTHSSRFSGTTSFKIRVIQETCLHFYEGIQRGIISAL